MNKEYLEALEEIRDFRYGKDKLLVCQTKMYTTIKRALQTLEEIENAEPSEALDSLEYLHNSKLFEYNGDEGYFLDNYYTVENYILKAQKQENVLNELLILINDLEPTFNRKGMVSMNDDNLGTFIKNYFLDNASDLLKRWVENE